jgi:hypothetical protein
VVHASADLYSLGENEKAGFHLSSHSERRAISRRTWPDPASSMQIHSPSPGQLALREPKPGDGFLCLRYAALLIRAPRT